MRAFKTEGIILKRKDFGEAERIITAFTLHRGKISIIAKGVRRITSRRAGNVELLNRVQMFLYPGKQFLNLTEATSLDTYQKIKEDLTLSTYAYHIIELVDKLTAENQENRSLYVHLVEVLKRLSENPRQIWIRAFEAKILSNLGFFSFDSFGVKLPHTGGVIDRHLGILMENLQKLSWEEIGKMSLDEKQALELERVLRYHIERVLEGTLKARKFLRK